MQSNQITGKGHGWTTTFEGYGWVKKIEDV